MDAMDMEVTERNTQLFWGKMTTGTEGFKPGRGVEAIGERIERRILFVQQQSHDACADSDGGP